ncbi:hypothetical protein FQA39_LY18494 [Lamprigera yunnana]|nr:hypothetical protein FQA39_LY18494 [Lamprigera yunnana]
MVGGREYKAFRRALNETRRREKQDRYEKRHITIDHRDVVTEYDDSMSGDDPREYENGSGNVEEDGTESKDRDKVQVPNKENSTTDQLDQESKRDLKDQIMGDHHRMTNDPQKQTPPGSLSDDCQAREVGDQAYPLEKNSGKGRQEASSEMENVINPFARRDSLTRTPPKAGTDMPREEMAKKESSPKKVKKRKISDSPLMVFQAAQEEPDPDLIILKKKIEELVKYGKANKNVQVEVKKAANELNMLINRAIGRDRRRISEIVSKQEVEQQEEITVIKETKEMGTQTYGEEEGGKLERINEGMMEG